MHACACVYFGHWMLEVNLDWQFCCHVYLILVCNGKHVIMRSVWNVALHCGPCVILRDYHVKLISWVTLCCCGIRISAGCLFRMSCVPACTYFGQDRHRWPTVHCRSNIRLRCLDSALREQWDDSSRSPMIVISDLKFQDVCRILGEVPNTFSHCKQSKSVSTPHGRGCLSSQVWQCCLFCIFGHWNLASHLVGGVG